MNYRSKNESFQDHISCLEIELSTRGDYSKSSIHLSTSYIFILHKNLKLSPSYNKQSFAKKKMSGEGQGGGKEGGGGRAQILARLAARRSVASQESAASSAGPAGAGRGNLLRNMGQEGGEDSARSSVEAVEAVEAVEVDYVLILGVNGEKKTRLSRNVSATKMNT